MEIQQTEFISPYSYIHHNWELKWVRIPSNKRYDRPIETRSEKEERALEAIASVGVIGGLQLKSIFKIGKVRLKNMRERHLVVRHSLLKNGREIPIYTIGKHGANKFMPEYEENYWVEMDVVKVLKSLLFFQFCQLFDDFRVVPAPDPFTAGIYLGDTPYYVYVERNGIRDLISFLKWKNSFSERMFIIAEKLENIKDIEIFMETMNLKLRVILDQQLKERKFDIYHYDPDASGKWVKD